MMNFSIICSFQLFLNQYQFFKTLIRIYTTLLFVTDFLLHNDGGFWFFFFTRRYSLVLPWKLHLNFWTGIFWMSCLAYFFLASYLKFLLALCYLLHILMASIVLSSWFTDVSYIHMRGHRIYVHWRLIEYTYMLSIDKSNF